MKRIPALLITLFLLAACGGTSVSSPDGTIRLDFSLEEGGVPAYSVTVDGKAFINTSALGVRAGEVSLGEGFSLVSSGREKEDSEWTQPWGENKTVRDRHNELSVLLENAEGVALTLRFRVFDDGFAYRYEYDVPGADTLTIMDEMSHFNFAADAVSWSNPAHFDSYEQAYREMKLSELEDAGTPMTFKREDGLCGSVHEAALVDYPEMCLKKTSGTSFVSILAPLSPKDSIKAVTPGRFNTPWRTVQIAREDVGLVNSSLILNLNEPCVLDDVSWIRPMKYVGVWWGMHLGVNSWGKDSRHGATTEEAIRYIDFAAANNIQAVLFEGWNDAWDVAVAGHRFDFTSPAEDFDFEKVLSYAHEKGVEYIIHHETAGEIAWYEAQLEKDLDFAAAHGIHAVKTGYASWLVDGRYHHGQYGVRHFAHVTEEAAKRHIMVDAHEPIKETGLRRTWPNFMTREGARGMEWNAWSKGNAPSHHVTLPYTRLLAGPMDYTPGVFDIEYRRIAGNPDVRVWNNVHSSECRVNTTLAKQIANWVILYSPLQMACDLIDNYEGHPAFQFFRDFDADCDESRALQGEIGRFISLYRRCGERYFYGASTDENGRTLTEPLSFLKDGVTYAATIYADAADSDWISNPYAYSITERLVTSADTLSVVLAPGGGQAISFVPVEKNQ